MNERDAYLKGLERALEGVSAECKTEILKELETHLADMEGDSLKGEFSAEMGDPKALGASLKQVHRPRQWTEFILALLPNGVSRLAMIAMFTLVGGYEGVNYALAIGFVAALLVTVLSIKRGSATLNYLSLIALLSSSVALGFMYAPFSTKPLFQLAIPALIFVSYVRTLLKTRTNNFEWTAGIFLLALTAGGVFEDVWLGSNLTASDMGQLVEMLALPTFVCWVVAMALLFVSQRQSHRWIGLTLLATVGFGPVFLLPYIGYAAATAPLIGLTVLQLFIIYAGWRREPDTLRIAR